jgi:myosin heavy subunit
LIIRINQSIALAKGAKPKNSIGVLDIFGFEIFKENSFEQLCINYTNEKLQQHFNQHTFKLEEQLYLAEKITFDHVTYIDNQPVLDLIESKPDGLLPTLDEVLKFPKATDKTFVEKLLEKHENDTNVFAKVLKTASNFIVKHYAGSVEYNSNGFLDKNKDTLSEDLLELLNSSKHRFIKMLISADKNASESRKQTLGFQFSRQLEKLMVALNQTEPHYIRCIKPNPNKSPSEFVAPMVLEQLTNSGVFEAVQIRKSGFPFRYTHEQFCKRYKAIKPTLKITSYPDGCRALIDEMKQDSSVQIGKTRVLYRAPQHRDMELKRNFAIEKIVVYVQKWVRRFLVKKLAKQWRKLKPGLLKVMKDRKLEDLEKYLLTCQHIRFPFYELSQARDLREILIKEKILTERLNALFPKDAEENFEEFSKAVAAADELNLKSDIANKVRDKLRLVAERRQCIRELKEGVADADKPKLVSALSLVKKLEMKEDESVKSAREMLARIEKEEVLVKALEDSLAKGGYCKEGDKIDHTKILDAVKKASDFGMKTAHGKKVLRLAEIILPLRNFLILAVGTKDRKLWDPIEKLVVLAQDEFGDNEEIKRAKYEVAHLAAQEEIEEKLEKAIEERNTDGLKYGLDAAAQLGMKEEDFPIVGDAKVWLQSITECRKYIKEGTENVDEETLVYAIQYADSIQFDTEEVKECRQLKDLVVRLNRESKEALRIVDPDMLKRVYNEAIAIHLSTPEVSKMHELLYDISEEKFLELQLQAAIKLKDSERITRVTIKSKDLFFSKMGDQYSISKYPNMLTPREFAEDRYYGLALNKDKIAAGFYVHTPNPIHVALTRGMLSQMQKEALRAFKTIMCYMGDRQNTTDPMFLAKDVVAKALEFSELRSEIYMEILKQLSSNPSPPSLEKGWTLLAICLDIFPPGKEFENYLEYWIRKCDRQDKDRYIKLFHQTVYGGAKAVLPSDAEITSIIQGKSTRPVTKPDYSNQEEKNYAPPVHSKPALPPKGGGGGAAPKASAVGGDDEEEFEVADDEQDLADDFSAVSKAKGKSPWTPVVDDSTGDTVSHIQIFFCELTFFSQYYYNEDTGETSWDKPAGL